MAANGAQYGVATVHFYRIGAIPAMVFLGLVMMPFYYGSREEVRVAEETPQFSEEQVEKATSLLDIRKIIGGLLGVYGLLLLGAGLFASEADKEAGGRAR
jgi:solute:Na+ symporter, SSS family